MFVGTERGAAIRGNVTQYKAIADGREGKQTSKSSS